MKRIKEVTSDLKIENKCILKQWTSVLGTNRKYFASVEYTSSVKALFAESDTSVEHKYVASLIIMDVLKVEICAVMKFKSLVHKV